MELPEYSINVEQTYDNESISEFFSMYCTETLLGADMTSILDLFE